MCGIAGVVSLAGPLKPEVRSAIGAMTARLHHRGPDGESVVTGEDAALGHRRLAIIDRLGDALNGYHAFHATRAELLRRLARRAESRAAYDRAIALAGNTAETAYLSRRREELGSARTEGI